MKSITPATLHCTSRISSCVSYSTQIRLLTYFLRDVPLLALYQPPTRDPDPKTVAWTEVQSSCAVMGGFAFDSSPVPAQHKFLPGFRDRVTLSPEAVAAWPKINLDSFPTFPRPTFRTRVKLIPRQSVGLSSSSLVRRPMHRLLRPKSTHQFNEDEYIDAH